MVKRQYGWMGGEELRRHAKRADERLAEEIVRLRIADPAFREALDLALEIEAEMEARRNR